MVFSTSDLNHTLITQRFENTRLVNSFGASMSSDTEVTDSMTENISIAGEVNSVIFTTSDLKQTSHLLMLLSVRKTSL
jgi:hypothetical protein